MIGRATILFRRKHRLTIGCCPLHGTRFVHIPGGFWGRCPDVDCGILGFAGAGIGDGGFLQPGRAVKVTLAPGWRFLIGENVTEYGKAADG